MSVTFVCLFVLWNVGCCFYIQNVREFPKVKTSCSLLRHFSLLDNFRMFILLLFMIVSLGAVAASMLGCCVIFGLKIDSLFCL